MQPFLSLLAGSLFLSTVSATATIPHKIYGVNLGSWLLIEPWMLPAEWLAMGGQQCDDCSECIASEFEFAKAYPDTVDEIFNKHWNTWFTQNDVNKLKDLGINTVRIPLGYWIVEDLVDRRTEFFPRGGLQQLARGLRQLKEANIVVILDHHALPGAQAVNQQFAGVCTSTPEFYTPYNYGRALAWTAVMTAITHIHPDFQSVFAIEAVNEPIMDASQTPGYGEFQKNFVATVRAVEWALGIRPAPSYGGRATADESASLDVAEAMQSVANDNQYHDEVRDALRAAITILQRIRLSGFDLHPQFDIRRESSLMTNFMDVSWQFNNPANPADAAIGPQGYDNHLYYVFGGVADPNPTAYMESICNLQRVQNDEKNGNTPLWFGEWGLPTQFNATDEFLNDWADAQKMAYSKGAGWIFWNFKVEKSTEAGDLAREWSYFEGVERGYLTLRPDDYHNPHVCDPYTNSSSY